MGGDFQLRPLVANGMPRHFVVTSSHGRGSRQIGSVPELDAEGYSEFLVRAFQKRAGIAPVTFLSELRLAMPEQ